MSQLQTRYVFVDTSMYQQKNFQFGIHALGRFAELCKDESIYLLMTSITEREVKHHIELKAQEAAKSITAFKKEIKILRNLPDLPHYGIFEKITSSDIEDSLTEIFDDFLFKAVHEFVDLSKASVDNIVDSYFDEKPPFSSKKKDEFPDAIVLHALDAWSQDNDSKVYILSLDGDMKSFSEDMDGKLIYENDLEQFISLVVKNDEAHLEPIRFAENRLAEIWYKIAPTLEEQVEEIEFIGSIGDVDNISIKNIEYSEANVQNADRDSSEFAIKIKFDVEAWHTVDDYDRSVWDPEEKKFLFIAQNRLKVRNEAECEAIVSLEYEEGLEVNADIIDSYIEDAYVELNSELGVELNLEHLPIFEAE